MTDTRIDTGENHDDLDLFLTSRLNGFMASDVGSIPSMPQPRSRSVSAGRLLVAAAAVLVVIGLGIRSLHGGGHTVNIDTASPDVPAGVTCHDEDVKALMGHNYKVVEIVRRDSGTAAGVGFASWLAGTIVPDEPCSDPCPIKGVIGSKEAADLLGSGQYALAPNGDGSELTLVRQAGGVGDYIEHVTFAPEGELLGQPASLAALAGSSWKNADGTVALVVTDGEIIWKAGCGELRTDRHRGTPVTDEDCTGGRLEALRTESDYVRMTTDALLVGETAFIRAA